jgi:hypothetical protein
VAFSPEANYTDWSTAACRRNLVPTFGESWVSRDQRDGSPTAVNISFLDRGRYFFFQIAPHLSSRGWVYLVSNRLLLRKPCGVGTRTRGPLICSQELWPLDQRGGLYTRYQYCLCRVRWKYFWQGLRVMKIIFQPRCHIREHFKALKCHDISILFSLFNGSISVMFPFNHGAFQMGYLYPLIMQFLYHKLNKECELK